MIATGRMITRQSGKFGGTRQAFYTPASNNRVEVVNGAMLSATGLQKGSIVWAGDLGYFDYVSGKVTALQAWKVQSATTTTLNIYKDDFTHLLKGDTILAVAPSLSAGTTTAATVTGVAVAAADIKDMGDHYEIKNDFGIAPDAKGIILVQAAAVGANVQVLVPKINWIFGSDRYAGLEITDVYPDNDGAATYLIDGYYHATIIQESKVIPPYALQLNKAINNSYIFEI